MNWAIYAVIALFIFMFLFLWWVLTKKQPEQPDQEDTAESKDNESDRDI